MIITIINNTFILYKIIFNNKGSIMNFLLKIIFLNLFFISQGIFTAEITIEMLNKNKQTKQRMVYSKE